MSYIGYTGRTPDCLSANGPGYQQLPFLWPGFVSRDETIGFHAESDNRMSAPTDESDRLPKGDPHDPFAAARRQMVEVQLPRHGIVDERVIGAMAVVPREEFVPASLAESAYVDSSLPIGCEQTISQPCVTALMCELARLAGDERVLEVGAGSGYGAAVLSHLAADVYAIERIGQLAERARRRLQRLGISNATVVLGDGTRGLPASAPFDAILVTAGADAVPTALVDQLAPGGRLIIPVGPRPRDLTMYRFTNERGQLRVEEFGSFAFVPLVSDDGPGL